MKNIRETILKKLLYNLVCKLQTVKFKNYEFRKFRSSGNELNRG